MHAWADLHKRLMAHPAVESDRAWLLPDQYDEPFAAGHAGIEKVPLLGFRHRQANISYRPLTG